MSDSWLLPSVPSQVKCDYLREDLTTLHLSHKSISLTLLYCFIEFIIYEISFIHLLLLNWPPHSIHLHICAMRVGAKELEGQNSSHVKQTQCSIHICINECIWYLCLPDEVLLLFWSPTQILYLSRTSPTTFVFQSFTVILFLLLSCPHSCFKM